MKEIFRKLMLSFIYTLALIGAFSVGLIGPFLIKGFEVGLESMVMQTTTFVMDSKANQHDFEVRSYWNNRTNYWADCKAQGMGSDQGCYMTQIYNVMKDFKYTLTANSGSQVYTPMYILTHEEGQCSNFAYTFCRSAFQFDIDCEIECNKNHCWNKVTDKSRLNCPKGQPCTIANQTIRTYHIDVTKKELYEVN